MVAKQSNRLADANERPDLLFWDGDHASLIREMKRWAGCEYDHELAEFLGKSRHCVATWRLRGAVPEAAVLRFERRMRERG